jgi:hypothetical protein
VLRAVAHFVHPVRHLAVLPNPGNRRALVDVEDLGVEARVRHTMLRNNITNLS